MKFRLIAFVTCCTLNCAAFAMTERRSDFPPPMPPHAAPPAVAVDFPPPMPPHAAALTVAFES